MGKIQYKWWCEVPDNLKSKTYCREERLNIKGVKAVAEVYQKRSRSWIDLYDITKLEKKKELTQNQLDGIKKAAVTRKENHTCKCCGRYDLMDVDGSTRLCSRCNHSISHAEEAIEALAERLSWTEEGNLDKYVLLETATTGLYEDDKIVEIAITTPKCKVLFQSLINPKTSISYDAMEKHNITQEMVKDAPVIDEVFDQIHAILKDKIILAYSAEFDRGMLIQSTERQEVAEYKWKCVMENEMKIAKTDGRISLAEAANIPWGWRSYRALEGCSLIRDIIEDRESIEKQIEENKKLMELS